jgi:hypothetical protein
MRRILIGGFLLAACSAAPKPINERDMPGVFSTDAEPGHGALMVQFLSRSQARLHDYRNQTAPRRMARGILCVA